MPNTSHSTRNRPIGSMSAVGALSNRLQFVSDSQDVEPIKAHIGESADGYDAFFVDIADGDYIEVWGICGIVPYTSKLTTRLL
jgi:uncharacterized protein DUF6839